MSGAGELMFRVAVLAAIVAIWQVGTWCWSARTRWGWVRVDSRLAGEGVYRRGATSEWRPRGVPTRVVLVGAFGAGWGAWTTAVLAPAGLLFLFAPAHVRPSPQFLLSISGLGVFFASIGGFGLGVALSRASRALIERDPEILDRALPIARWSAIHHVAVWSSFALFAIHERTPAIAFAAALPCSIGLAHAWSLAHGARFVARLRDDESASRSTRSPL